MRKLVSVMAAVTVLAACEQGPGTGEPERHEIEGTWKLVAMAFVHAGVDGEQITTWDLPSDMVGRFTFEDGQYELNQQGPGDSSYRWVGTYIIDGERIIIDLQVVNNSASRSVVIMTYELEGTKRATLRQDRAGTASDGSSYIATIYEVERDSDSN